MAGRLVQPTSGGLAADGRGLQLSQGRSPPAFDRRDTFSVPLYRTGDLDDLAARADIDWTAVRAVQAGRRSPLAALPTTAASSR